MSEHIEFLWSMTAAPGSPAPPSIEHVVRERGGASSYRLSWATTSFSPLMGHRLLLKEVREGLDHNTLFVPQHTGMRIN